MEEVTKKLEYKMRNKDFDREPCRDFGRFLDDPYYLGVGEDTYKKVREEGDIVWKKFLAGKITELNWLWGIGSGKSYGAELLACILTHWLLCLENPHKFFGLTNDKPIAVVNMGTTATQAKNVIFAGLRKFIENSDFFQEYDPEILQTEIRFPNKNITLYCGNSKEEMPIGLNVIFLILDEAAWFLDNENKSIAENIYNTGRNRIVSRFGNRGFVAIISAPRYVDDFISRHYEKNKNLSHIHCSSYKTWEVKDKDRMSSETFNFVARADEDGQPLEVWKGIPKDFQIAFKANPEKAMRDFGAKSSLVLEAFDKDAQIIVRKAIEREPPIDESGRLKDWFKCPAGDSEARYIHVDLGLKKDACGFAMGKSGGYKEVGGVEANSVYIDLVLQIKAKPSEEIMFSEVRELIYSLKDRGFPIAKVTFDGWQSVDSIQILNSKGIPAETLSVDRNTEAYDTLKEVLHTDRFDCYPYDVLHREYQRLELVKGKKVDHPQGGSKDVSDAVAGVCYNIVQNPVAEHLEDVHVEDEEEDEEDRRGGGAGNLLDKRF